MDIASLKELGIAGVSIATLGYISFKLIKEVAESRRNYTNFVNDNNHTTTELVKESTAAIVEAKNAIALHNEVLKSYLDKRG